MPPKRDPKTGRYTAVFGQTTPLGQGKRPPAFFTPTVKNKERKTTVVTYHPEYTPPTFGKTTSLKPNNNVFGPYVTATTSTSGFAAAGGFGKSRRGVGGHTSGGPVYKPMRSDFAGSVKRMKTKQK